MFRILCLVAVTVGIGAATLVSSAVAAPCGELVLRDWSRDGRVDRTYDLTCYEAAIDDLPSDLRDYSDAEVVITRALASAAREDGDNAVGEGARGSRSDYGQRPARSPRRARRDVARRSRRRRRRLHRTPEERLDGYDVGLMVFGLFAGIFVRLPTVRPESYHPLPARMSIIARPSGRT